MQDLSDLSDKLWKSTEETRQRIMQTKFIQKMKEGTLDPEKFGQFMIQDMAYCYFVKNQLEGVVERSHGHIKTFLIKKLKEHEKYCQDMFKQWSLKVPGAVEHIVLNKACQEYVNFLGGIAYSEDPIYFLVAFLPCNRVWPWIGEQLKTSLATLGIYKSWAMQNFADFGYGDWEGIVNMSTTINQEKAAVIYDQGMSHEYEFFNSFCPGDAADVSEQRN